MVHLMRHTQIHSQSVTQNRLEISKTNLMLSNYSTRTVGSPNQRNVRALQIQEKILYIHFTLETTKSHIRNTVNTARAKSKSNHTFLFFFKQTLKPTLKLKFTQFESFSNCFSVKSFHKLKVSSDKTLIRVISTKWYKTFKIGSAFWLNWRIAE